MIGAALSRTVAPRSSTSRSASKRKVAAQLSWWFGDFYDGKRQAARYFFRYELPKTAPQLDLLESLDRTPLEMRETWF